MCIRDRDYSQELDAIEENDSTWLKADDLGAHTATFAPREGLKFNRLHGIAMVMGDGNYATPASINSGKGDYLHTIYPDEDNYGDFDMVGIKKGAYIQSLASVKYTGFTISGSASPNNIKVSYETMVHSLNNASTVITAGTFTGATAPITGIAGRAFFRNLTFLINNQSAATLSATTDDIANAITSCEFHFGRPLAADQTNTSGLYIDEPVEDGYPEATLALDLGNFSGDVNTFITNHLANTAKKLQLEFTGSAASSATGTVATASFKIEAPNAHVMESPPGAYGGPGRIAGRVMFKLLGAATTSDAADMPFVEPFRIEAINGQSSKFVS